MAHSDPALAQESPLLESELDQADALVREAGWNQVAADWRIFFDFGTVYAVRNSTGRVVATAATLPYGKQFAWISMVLVSAEYRRQGLARRLMERCVHDLTERGFVPVLDATPAGRTVYSGIGFQDTWGFQRLACDKLRSRERPIAAPAATAIQPITDADWHLLCSFDAESFGADRSAMLGRLRGRVPSAEFVARREDRITGFLLGRDGQAATQLGPLLAEDDTTALALLERGLTATSGPIYIDLADSRTAMQTWLRQCGFEVQRPFTRMVYRRGERFDDARRIYAVAGPELG